MSKITTVADLKKWYLDADITKRNIMGLPVTEENVWLIREQCRMHDFYTRIKIDGDNPLRFLHASREDVTKVAYTVNDEKGQADIQTKTTIEKYMCKFGLGMNKAQKIVAENYCGGELNSLHVMQTLDTCGDGLFKFLMVELSDKEDCVDINDAYNVELTGTASRCPS